MTLESYRAQADSINLPASSRGNVTSGEVIELWQRATGLDYFGYRETLKRVCEHYHLKHFSPAGFMSSSDDLIIPVDDDDIIDLGARAIIRFFDLYDINVVTWTRVTVDHGRERTERSRYYLDSCNWAIRRSFLESFTAEEQATILDKHQQANRVLQLRAGIANAVPSAVTTLEGVPLTPLEYIEANRERTLEGCPWVLDIHETFSRYYLHSASISFLCRSGLTLEKIRDLPLHPLFDWHVYADVMKERDTHVRFSQAV